MSSDGMQLDQGLHNRLMGGRGKRDGSTSLASQLAASSRRNSAYRFAMRRSLDYPAALLTQLNRKRRPIANCNLRFMNDVNESAIMRHGRWNFVAVARGYRRSGLGRSPSHTLSAIGLRLGLLIWRSLGNRCPTKFRFESRAERR